MQAYYIYASCKITKLILKLTITLSISTIPTVVGTMYAGIAMVETICGSVGSAAGSAIYSVTVEIYRGMVFYIFSVFLVVACFLLL